MLGNLIKKQPNQTNSLLSFLPCLIDLFSYLSAQNAVHHDNDEPLQWVEDGKEDLKEGWAAVCDGQDGRHPGEGQERQNHAGAPQWCPAAGENSRLVTTSVVWLCGVISKHIINEPVMALIRMISTILECVEKINKTYPALSFSFTSVMPSLDTSLLKTRIPMNIFTCVQEKNTWMKQCDHGWCIYKQLCIVMDWDVKVRIQTRTTAAAGPTNA